MGEEIFKEIQLPKVTDHRGHLSFAEGNKHIPFDIARVYMLYGMSDQIMRGGHAHWQLEQVLIAVSGKFKLHLDNGIEKRSLWLDDPSTGIYVNKMVWHELDNFSEGAVCLSLASQHYSEPDYIRKYSDFKSAKLGIYE